jgi:tRNA A37 threonylcarbamoyladenosine dehydratase
LRDEEFQSLEIAMGQDARFGGIEKLYGSAGARKLAHAHVLIVGIGGVGSWVAEALARSGVGAMTLIDGDDVCVSNVNRQLHALDGTIGRRKVEVMAERVKAINPKCRLTLFDEFFRMDSVEKHFPVKYDYVVDAIDGVSMKATLIGSAHERKIPVITCGGAGGKLDPLRVQLVDLAETSNDRLLFFVRRKLRKHYGFPRTGEKFGVPCVYSPEEIKLPKGDACAVEPREEDDVLFGDAEARLACDGRLGSATFVTGAFAFAIAAHVVNDISGTPKGL